MARRLREMRAAVVRVIWDEAEREDAPFVEEALEELIAHEMRGDGFCAEPLDDHVARVCLMLDLSPRGAERWRDLPDPPDDRPDALDDAPGRYSSA